MLAALTQFMWQIQQTRSRAPCSVPECRLHLDPPSSHPASCLDRCSLPPASVFHQQVWEGRGAWWHDSRQHASRWCRRLGGALGYTHTHRLSCFSLRSFFTPTCNCALTQTPCGDFGNPSSDPNVPSQSRTKSPPPPCAAESSGARSLPASLFKSAFKSWPTYYFSLEEGSGEKLAELGLNESCIVFCLIVWQLNCWKWDVSANECF